MKIQNRLAILAATAIASMFITQAKAQYRPTGDDGITASPKVRAMLNERAQVSTPSAANITSYQAPATQGVTASPKVLQALAERKASPAAPQGTAVVNAQPRPATDGIAASPKLREQLNERSARQVEIAPLK